MSVELNCLAKDRLLENTSNQIIILIKNLKIFFFHHSICYPESRSSKLQSLKLLSKAKPNIFKQSIISPLRVIFAQNNNQKKGQIFLASNLDKSADELSIPKLSVCHSAMTRTDVQTLLNNLPSHAAL